MANWKAELKRRAKKLARMQAPKEKEEIVLSYAPKVYGDGSQEEIILSYFKAHPDLHLAPHEVHRAAFLHFVPLTSVRRAITNLAKDGFLAKTCLTTPGLYYRPVHCWALAG